MNDHERARELEKTGSFACDVCRKDLQECECEDNNED